MLNTMQSLNETLRKLTIKLVNQHTERGLFGVRFKKETPKHTRLMINSYLKALKNKKKIK